MAPPKTKSTTTPTAAAAMKKTTKPMPKKLKKKFQEIEILERLQGISYIKVLLGKDRPKEDDYVFLARASPALMRSCRLRSKHLKKVVYDVYNDMTWELTGIFIPINVLAMAQQGVQRNDTFRKRKAEKTTSNEPAKKQKGPEDAVDVESSAGKENPSEKVDMDEPTPDYNVLGGKDTSEEKSDPNNIAATAEHEATPKDIVMGEADPGKPVPDGSTGNITKEAAMADLTTNESTKATDDAIPRDNSNEAGAGNLAEKSGGITTENTPKDPKQETEGVTTEDTPKDLEPSVMAQAAIDAQIAGEMNVDAKQDGVTDYSNRDACPLYEVVRTPAGNSTANSSAIPRSLEKDASMQDAVDHSASEGKLQVQHEMPATTNDDNPGC